MKDKKFKTPLYGSEFTVIIYKSEKKLQKKFKNFHFEPPISDFDGGVFESDGKLYLVLFSGKKGYPTPGIIAHEAKHLVNRIFIDIGMELDLYNDEAEAYLLSWIVDRIHEMLK